MGKIVLVKKHFLCGFLVCGISVVEISYIMLEVVGCGSEFFALQMCKKKKKNTPSVSIVWCKTNQVLQYLTLYPNTSQNTFEVL